MKRKNTNIASRLQGAKAGYAITHKGDVLETGIGDLDVAVRMADTLPGNYSIWYVPAVTAPRWVQSRSA